MSDKTQTHAAAVQAAPPQMAAVGLTFDSIDRYAKLALKELQEHGDDAIRLVELGFRAFLLFKSGQYLGLLAALNDVNTSASALIAAIKTDFNL